MSLWTQHPSSEYFDFDQFTIDNKDRLTDLYTSILSLLQQQDCTMEFEDEDERIASIALLIGCHVWEDETELQLPLNIDESVASDPVFTDLCENLYFWLILQRMCFKGLVEECRPGYYTLSSTGKEYAENLRDVT